MPVACARSSHFLTSPLTKAVKASGVLGSGSAPSSAKRFLDSGSSRTRLASALTLVTTGGSVFAGANSPNYPSDE